ncbi:hypothetical protein FRB95_008764 [Tulasnella sp. JGI-2019a]|nr:hypothetical protein FRB95_008764 [Tulasnella sp. JGI-2019a]
MMTDDLPMFDAYNADDAEMVDDDEYDYEMQEEPAASGSGTTQLQEYDMAREDQADYEDVIIAEPTAPVPAADVLIIEEVEPAIVEERKETSQPIIPEISPFVAQEEPSMPLTDVPFVVDAPVGIPEVSIAVQPLEPVPEFPASESATVTATSPIIQLPDLPPDTTVPAYATESLATAAPTHPVESHEADQHDALPQNEVPASPQGDAQTLTVPPIAFYFEDKIFSLFHDNENGSPVLLPGRQKLYTSPLAELLREIKVQEHALFPGVEDCVLGLEYQELDLCIDQNCKYAMAYTLEDLSKALLACNHTSIEFNIFQITDFEQSLSERLKGNLPATVAFAQTDEPVHTNDQTTLPDMIEAIPVQENETGTGDYDTTEENQVAISEGAGHTDDERNLPDDTHPAPLQATDEAKQHQAQPEDQETVEKLQVPAEEPVAVNPSNERSFEKDDESEKLDKPSDEGALVSATGLAEHDEPAHGDQPLAQEEPPANDAPPQTEDVVEIASVSSATLESSNHDDQQHEPPYEGEEEFQSSAEGVDVVQETVEEQGDDGDYAEVNEEADFYGDDLTQQQADLDHSVAQTDETENQALDENALQNSSTSHYLPSLDGEGEDEVEEDELANDAHANEPSVSSSPLTEEEEFAEYDDEEPLGDAPDASASLATIVDTVQENVVLSSNGNERGAPIAAVIARKRSLEHVDPDDASEYNEAEDYAGSDAKRARVE